MIYVYILRCKDGSYYTGVTNDPEKRLFEHNEGLDPKSYTHSRRPVELALVEESADPLEAITREKQIKGWSLAKKEALIQGRYLDLQTLSKSRTTSGNSSDRKIYR